MKAWQRAAISAAATTTMLVTAAPAAAINLTGQTVSASYFTGVFSPTNIVPFTTPAVVGPGVEFVSTHNSNIYSGLFTYIVDVNSTGFDLNIGLTLNGGNLSTFGRTYFQLDLTGLSGLSPLRLVGYSCTSQFSCPQAGNETNYVESFYSDATSVRIKLYGIRNETYRFSLAPVEPVAGGVPEPASWAMLVSGFMLTGGMMRQRARRLRNVAA